MAAFLDLPAEIRNMIYRYCLVKKQTLIPYTEHYPLSKADLTFRKDLPTVALLQVCRTMETEAAAVLYGENVWRITSKTIPRVDSWWDDLDDSVWVRRASLFKHIAFVFDQQDLDRDVLNQVATAFNKLHSEFEAQGHRPGRDGRLRIMHSRSELNMEKNWRQKFGLASDMKQLTSIVFDLSRLFCYVGCCRREPLLSLLDNFMYKFGGAQEFVERGLKVQIKGIRDQEWNEVLRVRQWSEEVVERFTIINTESCSKP